MHQFEIIHPLKVSFPCTRTEHPKLFGFVLPCDSVYLIPRGLLRPRCGSLLRNFGRPDRSATGASRTYLIKHAHTDILFLKRRYYTLSTLHTQLTHPILSLLGLVSGFWFRVLFPTTRNAELGTQNCLTNQVEKPANIGTATGISFQSVIFSSFHPKFGS